MCDTISSADEGMRRPAGWCAPRRFQAPRAGLRQRCPAYLRRRVSSRTYVAGIDRFISAQPVRVHLSPRKARCLVMACTSDAEKSSKQEGGFRMSDTTYILRDGFQVRDEVFPLPDSLSGLDFATQRDLNICNLFV